MFCFFVIIFVLERVGFCALQLFTFTTIYMLVL